MEKKKVKSADQSVILPSDQQYFGDTRLKKNPRWKTDKW